MSRWFTLAFVFFSTSLWGQDSSLESLLKQALERNPEILAARARLQAARQRPAIDGSRPDPMVSAGYASVNGPFPGQGLGTEPVANIGAMVSQMVPARGKLRLRAAIARKMASGVEQEYWMTELSVFSRVKTAYHKLHHAYQMLDLLDRNRDLLERMTKIAAVRYGAGQAMQQDVLKTQTQQILLEARREKYDQDKRSREAELNALLARPLESPIARPASLEPREALASLQDLYREAEAHAPAIQKERAGIEQAELALNLARKDSAIDYTFGAGWATMGAMGSMVQAKVDFNLPLFTRSRQRAMVREALSSADAARRSYQATGNRVLFQIKDDWLQSAASWKLMRLYSTTLLPQAALTMESAMNAYANGQGDATNVLGALMSVLDAEMSYHEEQLNYHLALLRLEESTGVPLIDEGAIEKGGRP